MTVAFATQAGLERRYGAARVRQYLDHDGDGVVDAGPLAECLGDANGEVVSMLLKKGYTQEQLALLVADPFICRRACEIAIAYAAEAKPEWLNQEGKGPYDGVRERARRTLREMQLGELRPPTEPETGVARRNAAGEIGAGPGFIFAESDDCPRGQGDF